MPDSQTGPERLLAKARAGDGAALGRLLERGRDYLKLLARVQLGRRLQGKVDPSDLVQETFLEAQRDFDQFQGVTDGEWLAWLRMVLATNLANQIRHYHGTQRRDPRLERRLAAELEKSSLALENMLPADQTSPSRQAVRREETARLAEALERLPEDYRMVLVLRHFYNLSFAAAAKEMGRTVDSVKNLWVRALTRLRAALREESP